MTALDVRTRRALRLRQALTMLGVPVTLVVPGSSPMADLASVRSASRSKDEMLAANGMPTVRQSTPDTKCSAASGNASAMLLVSYAEKRVARPGTALLSWISDGEVHAAAQRVLDEATIDLSSLRRRRDEMRAANAAMQSEGSGTSGFSTEPPF